ncbi:radical SAM protein [Methanosphaera cuniculi]|uniref:FeMo cofactor biosynthesis protein NifB n=1 Tax=Methanosphaera cuniculi TaxID=1077256 RepID=A0A2A2HD36_9EURY|nr:radical SAM protein [Methanosphaera cuniculi]PAV07421.1 nitrogenase molybdenum-iron cofactor biosynthesis protein [Methanosphaera cuniculi]PWL08235.1 FeMo cofactor biosynthesis protein NifB [Methanosphaera cuniculi]
MQEDKKMQHFAHVTQAHPCFNEKIHDKVGRIHIPIAPKCNIQCGFCTRKITDKENRPGVASCIMSVDEAIEHIRKTTSQMPISVVGVAGPGDALDNPETLVLFKKVREEFPDLILCMSTNGLLAADYAQQIADVGVKTVTITINAVDPTIGAEIYDDIEYDGKVYHGIEGAKLLLDHQLKAVEKLSDLGVVVKVNSVVIPGVNDEHIVEIAKTVKAKGASIMNVLPLIPLNKFKDVKKPGCGELSTIRKQVEEYLPVFRACSQCRADAFGIPGVKDQDFSLEMVPNSHY